MGLWINGIIKNTIKQSFIIWFLMNPIASKLTKTEPGIDVAHLDDPHGGQLLMSPCTILGVEVAITGTNPTCLNAKSIHIEIQRSILMNVHALIMLNLSTVMIYIYTSERFLRTMCRPCMTYHGQTKRLSNWDARLSWRRLSTTRDCNPWVSGTQTLMSNDRNLP